MSTQSIEPPTIELPATVDHATPCATRPCAAGSAASSSMRYSLGVLLQVVADRRQVVRHVALAALVTATLVGLLLPDRYTAHVLILPAQQGASAGAAMLAQLGSLGGISAMGSGALGLRNPNDLQVALLKSATVQDAMVERFHLRELYRCKYTSAARKRWERSTLAESGLKDGLIHLSVTDSNPQRAAQMANGWVEEYKRLTASLALSEAAQRRLFFEQQLTNARQDLTTAEEGLKQTEQRTGVIEMDGQARVLIASAAMLRAQVAAKQVQIRAMRQFAGERNPDLERAQQELAGMQIQLSATDVDNDRHGGDLASPKGRVTEDSLDYMRSLREVKYRETLLELLARQYEMARVDEARQGSPVQVVDAANVPDRPSSISGLWIMLAGALAALPLGTVAALLMESVTVLRCRRTEAGSWAKVINPNCSPTYREATQ